jgi:[ribosomal protein S5]-alanine N-acetyltransferase
MPSVLETERLILRPFVETDIRAAFELFETHPDVYRFDPGFPRTLEQRAAIVRRHIADNQEDGEGTLAVTLKEGGRLVGQAGLQLYLLPWRPFAVPEVELYYKLGRTYWNAGYAWEACQALIHYAFEEIHLLRLVTVTHPDNRRSIGLLERLGFCIAPAPEQWPREVVAVLSNPRAGAEI